MGKHKRKKHKQHKQHHKKERNNNVTSYNSKKDGLGVCQANRCYNHGIRCADGWCFDCCEAGHANKEDHTKPPNPREFSPGEVTLLETTVFNNKL